MQSSVAEQGAGDARPPSGITVPGIVSLLAGIALVLPGCGADTAGGARPRNLVLISVDTLRADHLSCYGYPRPTSPHLDRLAESGVLAEQATACATWTVPSHMSMLTGLYTRTHGVDGWEQRLPEDVPTIAELLRDQGFVTAAFVNVSLLSKERSFDRGFRRFSGVPKADTAAGATERLLGEVLPWLRRPRKKPFFLFLHFYDVHSDYRALPEYAGRFLRDYDGEIDGSTSQLRAQRRGKLGHSWNAADVGHLVDLYDAGIRQFDEQVAPLLDYLADSEVGKRTLVLVTSDHGEEFFEHGGVLHGRTLYEELVHVPFFLSGPGVPAGLRLSGNVSLVDVVPTCLSLLGLEVPASCEGVDLSRVWRARDLDLSERLVFSEADKWLGQAPGNYRRMVKRGSFKLTYDRASDGREVFDLERDPGERADLSADESALRKALWRELRAFMEGKRHLEGGFELTQEERDQLEDLGYF